MGDANNTFTVRHSGWPRSLNDRVSQDVDMVTLRVNYRWGGPVIAKY